MDDQNFSVFVFDNARPESKETSSFAIAIKGDVVVSGYGMLPKDIESLVNEKVMSFESIANRFNFYAPIGRKDISTKDKAIQRLLGNTFENDNFIIYDENNYPAGKKVVAGGGSQGYSVGQHKINMI